jgi:hypothetical protein
LNGSQFDSPKMVSVNKCCAAVRGTTMRGIAVVPIATGTLPTIGTTILVFG